MPSKNFRWLVPMLFAVALVACSRDRPPGIEVVLTEADAGATLTVPTGARIVVRLASNPSTGYGWTEVAPPGPTLRALGQPAFEKTDAASRVVGAPGVQVFRYEVAAPGRARVVLAYARPWEPADTPAAGRFDVTVVARPR
jgi:inhibitor of cysteine peptidase